MQVIVSARHCEVTEQLREVVETQFRRLDRFEPRVSRAEVRLLEEKNRWEVEATVSVERAGLVYASAHAPDFRTAVDRAVDKLSRQLRKVRSRRKDHQATPRDQIVPVDEPGP